MQDKLIRPTLQEFHGHQLSAKVDEISTPAVGALAMTCILEGMNGVTLGGVKRCLQAFEEEWILLTSCFRLFLKLMGSKPIHVEFQDYFSESLFWQVHYQVLITLVTQHYHALLNFQKSWCSKVVVKVEGEEPLLPPGLESLLPL